MKFLRIIVELLYPNRCLLCGEKINKRYTCRKCLNIIEYYQERVETYANKETSCCKIISSVQYKGLLKDKILHYKFHNAKYLAPLFAEILFNKMKKYQFDFDIILSVPISQKRLKERGYNQSELVARYLSEFTQIKYERNILIKNKNNLRQSELTLNERKENVKDAYSIKNADIIKGKRILLVDDIYTTGATLNECARVLKQHGVNEVIGATVMYGDLDN